MMDDMGTNLLADDYTPWPAASDLTLCQDQVDTNHTHVNGTTTSPIEDSFYGKSYAQGKRKKPDLRDITRFLNRSARPTPTYSGVFTAELTTGYPKHNRY